VYLQFWHVNIPAMLIKAHNVYLVSLVLVISVLNN